MSKKPLAVALVAAAAVALPAGDALASDVLGSPLQDLAQTTGPCEAAAGCAYVQEKLPADLATVAPYSGVVVRWRVRGTGTFSVFAASYTADDTVVRRAGGVPEQVTSSEDVATFDTRFPIEAGQVVGLAMTQSSTVRWGDAQGADLDAWGPVPAVGAATLASGPRDVAGEMAYNVAIERDVDRDGFGDESQDLCPTDPATHGVCGSGGPPASGPVDKSAPTVAKARVTPRAFRARRGGTLRLTLSEAARLTLTVERCQGSPRAAKRCRRARRVGTIARDGGAGRVKVRLGPRFRGRAFARGRYRLAIRALDAAGNLGARVVVRFRVV